MKTGGVERGTIEINRAIAQCGWRSLVASSGGPFYGSIPHSGGTHFQLPLASKNLLRIWMNAQALEKLIHRERVDIVHARSRAPAWSAWIAAKRAGVPFLTTFHGVYGLQNRWKKHYNSIMTRGERVIAVSNFIAEHLREAYEVDPARIRVIQRGVDPRIFSPAGVHPQRMAELARAWRVPEDLPVILFPGRITRWKGQDVFIRALSRLPQRNFIALIVGDDDGHTDYRHSLEKLIVEQKLEGRVRFVGSTPHMAEAYTLARLVVATSTEPEAFGRVGVEAQALGRPVIATNHGGARETIKHGVTGWLVPPGDEAALARQISESLALTDDALGFMGAEGIGNAAHFSTEQMCSRTLEVYQELLAARKTAR